jgi:hypothetical protein
MTRPATELNVLQENNMLDNMKDYSAIYRMVSRDKKQLVKFTAMCFLDSLFMALFGVVVSYMIEYCILSTSIMFGQLALYTGLALGALGMSTLFSIRLNNMINDFPNRSQTLHIRSIVMRL